MRNKKRLPAKKPPEISPYVFTLLLLFFGLWCFYDGWLTTNPDMEEHLLFNRVLSGILIPWGFFDYFKIRKHMRGKEDEEEGPE